MQVSWRHCARASSHMCFTAVCLAPTAAHHVAANHQSNELLSSEADGRGMLPDCSWLTTQKPAAAGSWGLKSESRLSSPLQPNSALHDHEDARSTYWVSGLNHGGYYGRGQLAVAQSTRHLLQLNWQLPVCCNNMRRALLDVGRRKRLLTPSSRLQCPCCILPLSQNPGSWRILASTGGCFHRALPRVVVRRVQLLGDGSGLVQP